MKKSTSPFNLKKYLKLQKAAILERIDQFDGKLYLEFGGKLFDDKHASRVLPGFKEDSKIAVLQELKNKLEIIICINSYDIITGKVRNDTSLSYEDEVFRMIDILKANKLFVSSVVITKYQDVASVRAFRHYLESFKIKTYATYEIENYPQDVDLILSEEGFGKNDFIETTKPLVVVTAPGPGSGKMQLCLSLLYQDSLLNKRSGYAKYETFPTWNLGINHPINLAYEAATLDLDDELMIDHYYLASTKQEAVSYNRDLQSFSLLKKTLTKIYGESPYNSPTEMGVNKVGFALDDEEQIRIACEQEIIRRYYQALWQYKLGVLNIKAINKINDIMDRGNIDKNDRKVVSRALKKYEETNLPSAALSLNNNKIVTGKRTKLFTQAAAAIINALKAYAHINKEIPLLSESIITTIQNTKREHLHEAEPALNVNEVLIALAITANTGPISEVALRQIPKLNGNQMHSSHVIDQSDLVTLHKLGIDVTFEPQAENIFRK